MKQFYQTLIVVALVLPMEVFAQSDTTGFTLDECIRYALENTIDIKNAKLDEKISESKVKETVGIGLPQIDGNVTLQHNQKQPRFFSTYATAQGFAGTNDDGSPRLDIPGAEPDDIMAMPQFFQLPSSGNATLTINQLIFNSSYLVGLKAASTYKELSYRNTEASEINVVRNVALAYYAVLSSNELIARFESNIARNDSLLRSTSAMQRNGFSEEIDVDRIQVNLNNLKTDRLKYVNTKNLYIHLLKFQMNYPMDKDLEVSGQLSDLKVNENLMEDYLEGWDYKNRIEYRQLETQKRLQELNVKSKLSNSLPNLSAFATLGYSTQSPNISGIFKTESDIPSTSAYGPDKWYSFSTFGLSLNIPIFSGLQRSHQMQQEKLALAKIDNNFSALKQSIDLDIRQNSIQYENAVETLKSQQQNMDLADKVARVTKIKYEQGVGSNIEVIDAENSLRESQVNYYNALYDAIVAKINLEQAFGKITPSKYAATPSN